MVSFSNSLSSSPSSSSSTSCELPQATISAQPVNPLNPKGLKPYLLRLPRDQGAARRLFPEKLARGRAGGVQGAGREAQGVHEELWVQGVEWHDTGPRFGFICTCIVHPSRLRILTTATSQSPPRSVFQRQPYQNTSGPMTLVSRMRQRKINVGAGCAVGKRERARTMSERRVTRSDAFGEVGPSGKQADGEEDKRKDMRCRRESRGEDDGRAQRRGERERRGETAGDEQGSSRPSER
ncbi:hypothetical protein P7C73_g4701, partial [Tremellales sp. Uapishka_1]